MSAEFPLQAISLEQGTQFSAATKWRKLRHVFFRCCFLKWTSLPLKLHLWKKNMKDPTYLSCSISSYSIRFTTSIQKCLNCLLQGGEPQKKICWISLGPTKPTWFHGVPTVWCDSNLLGASRFHLSLVNVHDENLKQHGQFLKLLLLFLFLSRLLSISLSQQDCKRWMQTVEQNQQLFENRGTYLQKWCTLYSSLSNQKFDHMWMQNAMIGAAA